MATEMDFHASLHPNFDLILSDFRQPGLSTSLAIIKSHGGII
jgi:hypothetical protein